MSHTATLEEFIADLALAANFEAAVEAVKAAGLQARFESKKPQSRMLITHDKFGTRFNSELSFRANGVVYDVDTHKVLCVPASACNYKPRMNLVIDHFDRMKVYKIQDGTVVNLYWYGDRWCMGSANGYDISEYRWMGPNTYREEFNAVVAKYPAFSFDKLDRGNTYVVGFRCAAFHPLKTDPAKAWFIAAYSNATFKEVAADVGIPAQEEVVAVGKDGNEKLEWLLNECSESYKVYCADRTRHNYGYIVRGPFDPCGESSNVLFESALMKKIRKLMYNLPKKSPVAHLINNTNRLEFNVLKAYLTYHIRGEFIALFPDYDPLYKKYGKFITNVIELMVKCYRNKNLRGKLPAFNPRSTQKPSVEHLASMFMSHIAHQGNINVMSPECSTIVYNLVVSPTYLDLYFRAMVL